METCEQCKIFMARADLEKGSVELEKDVNQWLSEMGPKIDIISRQLANSATHVGPIVFFNATIIIYYKMK